MVRVRASRLKVRVGTGVWMKARGRVRKRDRKVICTEKK